MIGLRSLVTAHGKTYSVTEWTKQPECFVRPQALYQRLKTLGTDNPDPIDVEAALCFTQRLWTFYRKNRCITDDLIEDLGTVTGPVPTRNFNAFELAEKIHELSPQQRHVLVLRYRGHRTAAIAYATRINSHTVKTYTTYLLEHLGITDFDDWRLSEPEVQFVLAEHIDAVTRGKG